jgi:hypothetical protein
MKVSVAAVLVLLAMPSASRGATVCLAEKGTESTYWQWRVIDGKRCWYRGRSRLEKSELAWEPEERVIERKYYTIEDLTEPVPADSPLVPREVPTIQFNRRWQEVPR